MIEILLLLVVVHVYRWILPKFSFNNCEDPCFTSEHIIMNYREVVHKYLVNLLVVIALYKFHASLNPYHDGKSMSRFPLCLSTVSTNCFFYYCI